MLCEKRRVCSLFLDNHTGEVGSCRGFWQSRSVCCLLPHRDADERSVTGRRAKGAPGVTAAEPAAATANSQAEAAKTDESSADKDAASTTGPTVSGEPGSPSATTTINGRQLPAPDPKFGGVINENAGVQRLVAATHRTPQGRAERTADHYR